LRLLDCKIGEHEPGIHQITGLPFATWFVETDAMAERGQPILSLVSRDFLNDPQSIIMRLAQQGEAALTRYHYMVQNVKQFQRQEELAMQQAVTETLEEFDEKLMERLLEDLPLERRRRLLLRTLLKPEAALQLLPPEQWLDGLTEQQRMQILEILEREREHKR